MKKFINSVETVEDEMIQGLIKAYPNYLKKIDDHNVIVRAKKKEGKVALVREIDRVEQTAVLPVGADGFRPGQGVAAAFLVIGHYHGVAPEVKQRSSV